MARQRKTSQWMKICSRTWKRSEEHSKQDFNFCSDMFPLCLTQLLLLALMFGCAAVATDMNDRESGPASGYEDIKLPDHWPIDPGHSGHSDNDRQTGSGSNYTDIGFDEAGCFLGKYNDTVCGIIDGFYIDTEPPENEIKTFDLIPSRYEGHSTGQNHTNRTLNCDDKNPYNQSTVCINAAPRVNISSLTSWTLSNISWQILSEEARLFLTGPVSTIIIPSFYMVVCLISVPVNICALLVLTRRIKPKKPATIYMLNLAFADLLFATVLPFKITYHFKGNNWIFGSAMCRVVSAAFYWNMYCSVLLITLISVDRLLAVVYPINSLSWRSPRRAFIACGATWALSFAGSVHTLFTEQTFHLSELNITTCYDIQPEKPFPHYKIYYITLSVFLFFLPLIITAVSYTRVILTLNKDQPGVPDHSLKKRRAVMLSATVLVMFVLCFMPTNLLLIIHQVNFSKKAKVLENKVNTDTVYVLYLVFLCLGSLNCLLDPLVYFFGLTMFKKEVSTMLRCQKTKKEISATKLEL